MTDTLSAALEHVGDDDAKLRHVVEGLERVQDEVATAEVARNEARNRREEVEREVESLRSEADRAEREAERDVLVPGTNPSAVKSRVRSRVEEMLARAEELTRDTDDVQSVEHVDGRGWHGFRRRWAIKRKHLPVQDVAELGGWKTIETLQQIYQQPDDASMHRAQEGGEDRRLAL